MRLSAWLAVRRLEAWTFAIVAGGLGVLVGLATVALGAWETWRAAERESWPVVSGVVVRVEIRTDRVANGKPADSRVATYCYTLNDRPVIAEQSLAVPNLPITRKWRENKLRSLRSGPTQVHYNPANPAESWILAEPPLWEQMVIGLAFTLMGLMIALAGSFKRRGAGLLSTEPRGLDSLPKEPPGPRRWELGSLGLC
ncbi:MAG: DUF3592 domain-containing protein [Planctomycetia bacterium]|nr:DUF3592 domain-containing protein [Planctomycetia bacterium]